ncbi:MAG: hypothetical protein GY853_13910 [PVC group bacterium]|nr:hypothetical protein [PVC group bacterium]
MGEEITFPVNDTNRSIDKIIQELKNFNSPNCNIRAKALVLTNLEQAQLWSLKLINQEE